MNKKLFVLLVILMSLSLIGIIFVQGYWIKRSVDDKEEQFSNVVSEILNKVSDKIESREINEYSDRFLKLKDSVGEFKRGNFNNIFFIDRDINSEEILFYSHGILEEEYTIPSMFFDNGLSSDTTTTPITNYTSKRTKAIFKRDLSLDGKGDVLTPLEKQVKIGAVSYTHLTLPTKA